jgi:hypothetical protein
MTGTYGRFCEFAAYSFLVAEMTNGEGAREAARACTRWLPADFPGIGAWTQWWTVEAAVLPSLQVLQDDMYGEGHRRMHARKVDEATGDRALRAPAYSAGPHLASTDMTDGEAARDASFRAERIPPFARCTPSLIFRLATT